MTEVEEFCEVLDSLAPCMGPFNPCADLLLLQVLHAYAEHAQDPAIREVAEDTLKMIREDMASD